MPFTRAAPASRLLSAPVLVVDDIEINREIIGRLLQHEGYSNLAFAVDGIDALEKIAQFRPEVVVLDVMMPRMDGLEVCRRLREDPATMELPILVQTALDLEEARAEIFGAGASDLLSKPIDRVELSSRIRLQLERQYMIRGLREHQQRLLAELREARTMQRALLPSAVEVRAAEQRYGLGVGAFFATSSELGGDFWGLTSLGEEGIGVYCVDFAGHGVSAALNTFRLHALIGELSILHFDPVRFLAALNGRLRQMLEPGKFATMLYGIIDWREGCFRYAAAGAPPPLVRLPTGAVLAGDGSGLPLGIVAEAGYALRSLPLPPGATLLLYSDGLSEFPRAGTRPGDDGVLQTLQSISRGSAETTVEAVRAAILGDAVVLPDDVTLLAIERRDDVAPEMPDAVI